MKTKRRITTEKENDLGCFDRRRQQWRYLVPVTAFTVDNYFGSPRWLGQSALSVF